MNIQNINITKSIDDVIDTVSSIITDQIKPFQDQLK